jgi:hypothetical protein
MPRPPSQPDRSDIPAEELDIFDGMVARFQSLRHDVHGGPMDSGDVKLPIYAGALLNSPTFAAALGECSRAARTAGERPDSYSHADREWVDQVLGLDWGHHGVVYRHTPDALAVGVRLDAIEALRDGRDDDLTEHEQLLTRYIREVASGAVQDETYVAIEADMGKRATVEYTIFITYLMLVIRLQQAFGEFEFSDEEIRALLQEFRDGGRELPDYRQRIR